MTKQGSSSITGRGLRRRLRSLISRQKTDETKQATAAVNSKKQESKSKPPQQPYEEKVQEQMDGTDAKSTPEPVTHAGPSNGSTTPTLSFAERIAQGQHNNTTIDLATAPSFTSGPAALQAAQQLSEEASTSVNQTGQMYWGPIDNESARSKADGQLLVIDQEECISCGTCVENTEHVFFLPDDAKAVPIEQEGPMDLIQDAIDACPVTCIHWTHSPKQYPQLNDQHGKPIT